MFLTLQLIGSAIDQCTCDLTGNGCDVNCCCDLACDSDDRLAFSQCDDVYSGYDESLPNFILN